mgnify:CR=1 FL=1
MAGLKAVPYHPVDGYGSWTEKEGITHVEPPPEVLESMVTLRVHLDDTPPGNGPLKVIRGSHSSGKLSSDEIASRKIEAEVCLNCKAGDVLMMRPLILHSSGRAQAPSHRRVLHFEFGQPKTLNPPLKRKTQHT